MAAAIAALLLLANAQPLVRAHSHNDYRQPRPLLDALDHGFCSVEADVFLVGGDLLVGHDRKDLRPDRKLEALYLDPLERRVRANGGHVLREGVEFTLLIDIKADGETVYDALKPLLEKRRDVLTRFEDGKIVPGAITVILSGDRPRKALESEPRRLAAMDGRLIDLGGPAPAGLIPLVSDDWLATIRWIGVGTIPADALSRLRDAVRRAHAQGRRIRFWGAPDTPKVWKLLIDERVDLVGADSPRNLRDFLRQHPQGLKSPLEKQGTSGDLGLQ